MKKRNLTIAVAPDSFKGTLTAMEAAACIERGLKNIIPHISVRKVPMADGGEGTVTAIVGATDGKMVSRTVQNPLGKKIKASFGLTGDKETAVIEMAAANGLALLASKERNPMKTSSHGTGELIYHALNSGAKKVLVGIGGSATNDGGAGMAQALGIKLLDRKGHQIKGCGEGLGKLDRIDMSGIDPRLASLSVEVACDVDNPLTGEHGASYIYGPQKGATPDMVKQLNANLKRLADIIKRDIGVDVLTVPGSGAAGGLGGGLMAFLGGKLRSGVDIVIDIVKLKEKIKGCDLVIAGEGRMDGQTVFGKTASGVAKIAKQLDIPVISISGCTGEGIRNVHSIGVDAYFSALQECVTEEELHKQAPAMLTDCTEQIARLLSLKII